MGGSTIECVMQTSTISRVMQDYKRSGSSALSSNPDIDTPFY